MVHNIIMNKYKFQQKWLQKGIFGKTLSIIVSLFVLTIFIGLFVFLLISAIPAFSHFKIFNTTEFNLSNQNASIWMPLSITLLVSLIAILIATPIGIKTATFIKYRLSEKYSKRCFIIIQTLAGIPSVIFGLFALTSLGSVVKFIFNLESVYTIINATIMLAFMILPTIISLTINTYDAIDEQQLLNPISLGFNKTSAIYKVIRKEAFGGIVVAVIIAIGRTIGETMALCMILNNSDAYDILKNPSINLLTQSLGTISTVIATNMFSETGGESQKSILYLFGIFLLVLVIILNLLIMFLSSNKNKNMNNKLFRFWKKIETIISNFILWVPRNIEMIFTVKKFKKLGINWIDMDVNKFISKRIANDKFINIRNYWLFGIECLCALISFGFLTWIILDIAIKGFNVIFTDQQNSSIFQYSKNTTGQAFLNTVIIVISSLIISIPISLLTTIYLIEYCKNNKFKKGVFFFVDAIASSPSIIFGMFGLNIFIRTFGWTSAGVIGRSLIAGALTISIVVLPTLIRMFERAFSQVPNNIRESGLAMGISKWVVITKIVIPNAMKILISSIVLVAGKIMSETAPLYLTAGLSSASKISLLNPGQTLTTRIYAQTVTSNNLSELNACYESALASLMIMLILIYIGYVLIPNWKLIKQNILNYFLLYKNIHTRYKYIDKKIIKYQTVKNIIYISYSQMKELDLNFKVDKKIMINNNIYHIKYLQDERLQKMILKKSIFV